MTSAISKLDASAVTRVRDLPARNTASTPVRREVRADEIRIAQYTPFPRESASQQPRVGFTRDVSGLGMCLGVDQPESLGSLLKIDVRSLDGQSMGASIARVVWCTASRDGRHWMGLDLLCETTGKNRVQMTAEA